MKAVFIRCVDTESDLVRWSESRPRIVRGKRVRRTRSYRGRTGWAFRRIAHLAKRGYRVERAAPLPEAFLMPGLLMPPDETMTWKWRTAADSEAKG